MKDNRGFSLIELLVVIAILGIVAAFGIAGLGYIFGTNARSCANEIYSAIGHTRIETMGRATTALRIYEDETTGACMAQEWIEGVGGQSKEVGKSTVEVAFFLEGDPTEHIIDGSEELIITFDRESGKVSNIVVNVNGSTTAGMMCERIEARGGGRVYAVNIVLATGKVTK